MSATSSVHHPTLSYQLDPLLNISPLIDLYSECLTHVVDTDGLFQLADHKLPIILSHKGGILNSGIAYQPAFARVRSPRCLLTITALFFSWNYKLTTLRDYINKKFFYLRSKDDLPVWNYGRIFPQSFITVTNQSTPSIDLHYNNAGLETCLYDLPLYFTLQLTTDVKRFPRIAGALNLEGADSLEFNCSTLASCKIEMEHRITVFAELFRVSWYFKDYKSDSDGGDPFERTAGAGMTQAVNRFVLGPKRQGFSNKRRLKCRPAIRDLNSYYSSASEEQIPAGRTAAVKFVTTAGVFTPKSSYRVYFSPFSQRVWFGILISAGISMVAIIGTYRMQREHNADIGLLILAADLATWALASAIGQFKHSQIPMIPGRLCRKVIWIVAPVVASWFILFTFILNVYSAIFSSDATRNFYYLTNYTEILQLPQDAQVYILVNESYVRNSEGSCKSYHGALCRQDIVPSACSVYLAMTAAWTQIFEKAKFLSVADATSKKNLQLLKEQYMKMQEFIFGASYICANTESLGRVLRQSEKPLMFLMSEFEFQKYWQLFVRVMQNNPNVKVANNFYSDDSLLTQPVVFRMTNGLHPTLKDSVIPRIKILFSSGIYGLWEKWYRIRFTDGGLRHAEKTLPQENKVDPLSFENSGTLWIFHAQGIAWLVATGILMVEIFLRALKPLWIREWRKISPVE